jgi:glutaredoxin 3
MPVYRESEPAPGDLGEGLLTRRATEGGAARLTPRDGQVYSRVAIDITLYSRAWCSWCIDAKEYLTERGYQFTEIDVGKDREAYNDMLELSDQTYVPTLVAGDEVLANFDTDQLEKFLNKHGIEP